MVQSRVQSPMSPPINFMRKKIIFVPGWTRSMKFYKHYEGVEAWKSKVPLPEKIEADYIIARSLGANLLLGGLIFNHDAKIILINPLLSEEKNSKWIWIWIRFVIFGSPKIDWHMNPLNVFSSHKKFSKLKKIITSIFWKKPCLKM